MNNAHNRVVVAAWLLLCTGDAAAPPVGDLTTLRVMSAAQQRHLHVQQLLRDFVARRRSHMLRKRDGRLHGRSLLTHGELPRDFLL